MGERMCTVTGMALEQIVCAALGLAEALIGCALLGFAQSSLETGLCGAVAVIGLLAFALAMED